MYGTTTPGDGRGLPDRISADKKAPMARSEVLLRAIFRVPGANRLAGQTLPETSVSSADWDTIRWERRHRSTISGNTVGANGHGWEARLLQIRRAHTAHC